MFSSLRARLWLSYAWLIITALGITALILIVYLIRSPLASRQTLTQLNTVATVILENPQANLAKLPAEELQPLLTAYDQNFGVRLLVVEITRTGRSILADSRADSTAALEIGDLRIAGNNQSVKDLNGIPWLATAKRLGESRWLVVTAPRPKLTVLALIRDELFLPFFEAGAIAFLLSLIAAYSLARWVGSPLQRMLNTARSFPSGEQKRLPLEGPREVKDLTRAFNEMTSRVQASQDSQREFVANVSHELKTPLTSIQGFAQAILDGTADTDQSRKQAATIIYNEAGRMHRMVLDLLDLARLDAGTVEFQRAAVDINALLHNILEKFTPQAQKANILLSQEGEISQPILGDGDRLAQVFTNLVDNALKFTPPRGQVRLLASQVEDKAEVTVNDTGIGIPSEALPAIFNRFYQADTSRKGGEKHGAGLGLAIAREIIQAHGGTISVRSEPARGSSFTVRLPILTPETTTIVAKRKR